MRLFVKLFLSIALLVGAAQAHAGPLDSALNAISSAWQYASSAPSPGAVASSATAEAGAFFTNLEGIAVVAAAKFTGTITASMYSAGMGVATGLTSTALKLAGSLALMYMMVTLVMSYGSSSHRPMTEMLFEVSVPCVIAGMLISGFSSHMDSMRHLLNIFASVGTDPVAGMVDFFKGSLTMIKLAIQNVFQNMQAASLLSSQMVVALADGIAVLLLCIPILFLVVVGLAEVFGLIILGPFLLAIGVAFGPLMIAGMVTPWTRPWFTSWLYFLLGSAMVTGVTRVALMIGSGIFTALGPQSLATPAPAAATLGLGVLMLLAVNGLISQIPGIASAMVPGSIGAKSPTDSMVRQGKQSLGQNQAAGRMAAKPVKYTAGKVGSTAGKAARLTSGALGKIWPK